MSDTSFPAEQPWKSKLDDTLIDFDPRWINVLKRIKDQFGKKPDLEAVLFLIGMQEIGMVFDKVTKEQKQDLMHIAVCRLLSQEGYYRFVGDDENGWPHWEPTHELPAMTPAQQEVLLKKNVIRYFEEMENT